MKKILPIFLAVLMILLLSACGQNNKAAQAPVPVPSPEPSSSDPVDVDLTQLSSTMVYSEVYAMAYEPEQYMGKTVKMKGQFSSFEGTAGQIYYTCIVQDATACCAQGLEFELRDNYSYPDDYPELGDEITVVGTFDTYREEYDGNYYLYIILRNAKLV